MKRAFAIATLAAVGCAPHPAANPTSSWKVTARVQAPAGASLMPDNAAQPGTAASQAIAYSGGTAFALLGNLYQYQPAGPSFVAALDGKTLAQQALIPLASGNVRCTNAGAIRVDGSQLLVACAGSVSLDPTHPTNQGVLAKVSVSPPALTATISTGASPGSVLHVGNTIWMGDLESVNIIGIDADSNTVGSPQPVCASGYVSDLAAINGRAFASCFNDNTVHEFDPVSGAQIGSSLNVGDGPVHMATFPDRITVVDSLSGTLSFIFPTTPATTQREAVLVAGQQGGDDVEGIAGDGTWAAAADSGFGTLVVFDIAKGFALSDAVDMKDNPTDPTNDPYGVAYGDGAFFVAIAGFAQPSEIVRVEQVTQ